MAGVTPHLRLVRLMPMFPMTVSRCCFQKVPLMPLRCIHDWLMPKWWRRLRRFLNLRKRSISRFGHWCCYGWNWRKPIKMPCGVHCHFWPCQRMQNYLQNCSMRQWIQCGVRRGSKILDSAFIQGARPWPLYTARPCWPGLPITAGRWIRPLNFLIAGLPMWHRFPKQQHRCAG